MPKFNKKKKSPPKYNLGGDILAGIQNTGVGILDTAMSALGADTAVDSWYSDNRNMRGYAKTASNYGKQIGKLTPAIAGVAGTAVGGPMAGQAAYAGMQGVQAVGGSLKPEEQPNDYFEQGGLINMPVIEAEKNELEVKKGRILKDLRGFKSHKQGGIEYPAKTGNVIIPENMRTKYMEGDLVTRNTIELQLKKDQLKRNEGFSFKYGGAVKKYFTGGKIDETDPTKFDPTLDYNGYNERYNNSMNSNSSTNNSPVYPTVNGNPIANNEFQNSPSFGYKPDVKTNPTQANNYNKYGYYAATAAPIVYDLAMGLQKPDTLNQEDYQNPNEGKIKSLMANRSINMKPIRDRILAGRQVALGNIKNSQGMGGGSYLSNAAQVEANTQNAYSTAQMQEMDYNNRYRGEEANTLDSLGQQRARTKLGIKDINDKNKAAKYAHLAKASEGISGFAQNEKRMSNMAKSDDLRMSALQDLFGIYGQDQDFLKFYNKYRRKQ